MSDLAPKYHLANDMPAPTLDRPDGVRVGSCLDVEHDESAARTIDLDNEERFHDEWGKAIDAENVPVIESFEACTAPENRFIMNWLGDVRGLRVLDLGCGAGEAAVYLALQGAKVTAADISTAMLDVTGRVARRYGVNVALLHTTSRRIDVQDGSFDVVYAANVFHHVPMGPCLHEICRVLKPGGRLVSWDPLRHNPIINIYRAMASAVRTVDEMPLSVHDVNTFERFFDNVEHRCFWLASLWLFVRFFLIEHIHPSKERYWKRIITDEARLSRSYHRLAKIDRFLMKRLPWLKRMCWNLVICASNPIARTATRKIGDVAPAGHVSADHADATPPQVAVVSESAR